MSAADDGADWSLVNFAKQVFGAKPAAPETAFNFVEPPPAEEEPASTAAETDQVAAPEHDAAAAKDETAPVEEPVKAVEPAEIAVAEVADIPSTEAMQPTTGKEGRQSRTASEMADMVLNALRADYAVPARGFVVTVYGAQPWNAMLTIKPEAGPIKDARLWRERVQDIGAQLRRDFDVIHDFEDADIEIEAAKIEIEAAEIEIEAAEIQSPVDPV
jgi:hypothetical protein